MKRKVKDCICFTVEAYYISGVSGVKRSEVTWSFNAIMPKGVNIHVD